MAEREMFISCNQAESMEPIITHGKPLITPKPNMVQIRDSLYTWRSWYQGVALAVLMKQAVCQFYSVQEARLAHQASPSARAHRFQPQQVSRVRQYLRPLRQIQHNPNGDLMDLMIRYR